MVNGAGTVNENARYTYQHTAFPQPADTSVTLWRYLDSQKFRWLAEHSRLFMPSADKLGDPLEGTTPDGELEWWQRAAAIADTEEKRQIIRDNREMLSRFAQAFHNHYYVSCWHTNPHENFAMWDCYTKTPEAVAIRATCEALSGCVPSYVQMGKVRYIDYDTDRLPSMNMFEYIMHKDVGYSFEQEVRVVAFPPVVDGLGRADFFENSFELESTPDFLVYAPTIDLVLLVHGVVLHPKASSDFEAEMNDLCSRSRIPRLERSRKNRLPVF